VQRSTPVLVAALFVFMHVCATGCGEDCGACVRDFVELTVVAAGASAVTVSGAPGFVCGGDGDRFQCNSSALEYGDHTLTIRAAGFDDSTYVFTLEDQDLSGCECPVPYEDTITLVAGGADAGAGDGG
jgi:hypothetical protein